MQRKRYNYLAILGCGITVLVVLMAALAPVLAPADPNFKALDERLLPPFGAGHVLGTDNLGRDILSRIFWGARTSLLVSVTSVLISGAIGTALGLLAGYYRGWVDALISRIIELQMSFPTIVLALIIATLFDPGLLNVTAVLVITGWVVHAKLVRGAVMSLSHEDFVQAARALGAKDRRILGRHVLRNILPLVIVVATQEIGKRVILESTLSYLGVGLQPPNVSWGLMLLEGQTYITTAWWIAVFPGLAPAFTVLGVNLFGDWLREKLDPMAVR